MTEVLKTEKIVHLDAIKYGILMVDYPIYPFGDKINYPHPLTLRTIESQLLKPDLYAFAEILYKLGFWINN